MGSAILAALGCILLLVTQTLPRLLTTQHRLKMKLLCLLLSALTISCAYGGVVRQDDLVDMIQGVIANPEAYASALGMVREKRSAWDKTTQTGPPLPSWSSRVITNQELMASSTSMTLRSLPWTTPGLLTLTTMVCQGC